MAGHTQTLPTVRVAHRPSQSAHTVAVAWLARMCVITQAQVIHMGRAAVTAKTSHASLTPALPAFLVTHSRSFNSAPGVTVARLAALKARCVPVITARVALTALCVWPAHTLTCYRVTHRALDGTSRTAVAGHAYATSPRAIGARRAGVTEETLNAALAFALA